MLTGLLGVTDIGPWYWNMCCSSRQIDPVNILFKFCYVGTTGTFARGDCWQISTCYTPIGAFEPVERKKQGSQYKCSFLSNRCLTEGLNTSEGQEEWLVRGDDA